MDPSAIIWLVTEAVKLVVARVAAKGLLNNLTQAQAEAEIQTIAASLPAVLPAPTDLENPV